MELGKVQGEVRKLTEYANKKLGQLATAHMNSIKETKVALSKLPKEIIPSDKFMIEAYLLRMYM